MPVTGAVNIPVEDKSAFLSCLSVIPEAKGFPLLAISGVVEPSPLVKKFGCNGLVIAPVSLKAICVVVPKVEPNPITKSSDESSNPI